MPQERERDRLTGNMALVSRIDDVEGLSDHARLIFTSKGIRYLAQLAALPRRELLHCTENHSAVNQAGTVLRAAGLQHGDVQAFRGLLGYRAPANRHGVLFPDTTDEGMRVQPARDRQIRSVIVSFFDLPEPSAAPVLSVSNHGWFSPEQHKSLKARFRDAVLDDPEFKAVHTETRGRDREGIRNVLNKVIARKLDLG